MKVSPNKFKSYITNKGANLLFFEKGYFPAPTLLSFVVIVSQKIENFVKNKKKVWLSCRFLELKCNVIRRKNA